MRSSVAVGLAILAAVPAALVQFGLVSAPIELDTLFDAFAVVGASFAIAWGAEASEHDIPRALALTAVALLAVLPEYAVDIVFAFNAGENPAFAPYAAANMTGSNRLLLGLGWPTVSVLAWLATGRTTFRLSRDAVMPLVFLSIATIYSFILPVKANIGLIDSVILFALFGVYAVLAAREETEVPDLVGPAAAIGSLPAGARRMSVVCLLAFAGVTIGAVAGPFAEGLVETGRRLGIDEFLLVQWLAPIASEAPEFLVAAVLAARGKASAALALLLVSKLNQWTLLVGSLPVAYAVGVASNTPGVTLATLANMPLPLDPRQVAEVFLTAAQGVFGVAVLASLSLRLREAFVLAGVFLAQLVLSSVLRISLHNPAAADATLTIFGVVYLALGVVFAIRARRVIALLLQRRRRPRDTINPERKHRVRTLSGGS